MPLIAHFLLVLYACFILYRPAILVSEKSQNVGTDLNFTLHNQVAKVYTAPIFHSSASVEYKNISPIVIATLLSVFNFSKSSANFKLPKNYGFKELGFANIEWPKICINAP